MSLKISYEDIIDNIMLIQKLDASICKTLALACLSIKDDMAAEFLLKKIRAHLTLSESTEEMYQADYYLEYVNDILLMTEGFEQIPAINMLRNKVRDMYETLIYNKESVIAALNNFEKQDLIDGLRENYWIN